MFKRRDWVHLKGKDGRAGDSSSDDESDEEEQQRLHFEEPADESDEGENSDEGEEGGCVAAVATVCNRTPLSPVCLHGRRPCPGQALHPAACSRTSSLDADEAVDSCTQVTRNRALAMARAGTATRKTRRRQLT